MPQLLSRLSVECLVHGNVVKDDALAWSRMVEETLRSDPVPAAELPPPRCLLPARGSNDVLRVDVPDPDNLNSAVEFLVYVGDDAYQQLRVRLQLYAQMAQENCFDTLRTKEQLGYLCQSSIRGSVGFQGFRVAVQSERDAGYVESRIEAWLASFREHVANLPDAEFESHRTSLINRKLEDVKNLSGETNLYWSHIHSGYYDFDRSACADVSCSLIEAERKDATEIAKLTKADIVAFADQYLVGSSSSRAKLAVHMRSQRINEDVEKRLRTSSLALPEKLEGNPGYAALREQLVELGNAPADVDAALQRARDDTLPDGVRLLESADAFRSAAEVGPPARPVAAYFDWCGNALGMR